MKQVEGFWYPDSEERLHRGHARYSDIREFIVPYLDQTRTCIHAGAGAGTWTAEYTEIFDYVYTAEPNEELRQCVHANSRGSNYALLEGAFWRHACYGSLVPFQPENMGAWYMAEHQEGTIPMFSIDSLGAEDVDLIQLDVEGAEFECVLGARETISRDRPVIVLEVKAITQQFHGRTVADLRRLMHEIGYRKETQFGRDELWVPMERN